MKYLIPNGTGDEIAVCHDELIKFPQPSDDADEKIVGLNPAAVAIVKALINDEGYI